MKTLYAIMYSFALSNLASNAYQSSSCLSRDVTHTELDDVGFNVKHKITSKFIIYRFNQLCMMLLELELNMHSIGPPDMLEFCFFWDMLDICLKLNNLEIKGQIIKLGIIGLTNLC